MQLLFLGLKNVVSHCTSNLTAPQFVNMVTVLIINNLEIEKRELALHDYFFNISTKMFCLKSDP